MNTEILKYEELVLTNGGLQSDYNAGYAAGRWLRAAVDAIGDTIDAFSPFS